MREIPARPGRDEPFTDSRRRHSNKRVFDQLGPGLPDDRTLPGAGRRRLPGAALALNGALVNNYANGIGWRGLSTRTRPGACLITSQDETERTVKLFERVLNPREIRRRLGLNQEQFWTQIGVTQSGGSRYESGREMPKPVRELLRLVHVEQVDLSQVKRVDFEIISYLKESHPDLYRNLRRAARNKHKHPDSDGDGAEEPGGERHSEILDDND